MINIYTKRLDLITILKNIMDKNYYKKKHGFFLEDLEVGQEASIEKKISEKDIMKFAELTGDDNPVHVDEEFAKNSVFKKRIAHGFLSGSLISTLIATKLPGPGSIYLNQSMKFLAPVFINDVVKAKVSILEKLIEKKKILLKTECFILNKKIITGSAEIMVSSRLDIK